MVVPTIDILLAEQLQFAKRVNQELEDEGKPGKVEAMIMEKCFHGWLECEHILDLHFCPTMADMV